MKFSIGDRIMIKADAEELQNGVIEMVDGTTGTISEIYQNSYEPDVDRFEVELDEPIEYNGDRIRIVPGLYSDNIELIKSRKTAAEKTGRSSKKRINERYAMSFADLVKKEGLKK
jgi:hypothetical protein